MFIVVPGEAVASRRKADISKMQTYKVSIIVTVFACMLAAALTVLKVILVQWTGNDEGLTILQQSAIGLAVASIGGTSAVVLAMLSGRENKNGSNKPE